MNALLRRLQPFDALVENGVSPHQARRLSVLFWGCVVGALLGSGYAPVNISTGNALLLVQNVLLFVLSILTIVFLRRGNAKRALELGFLPLVLMVMVFQVMTLFLEDNEIQQALYMPLTFILLTQLAAFFALRVRHFILPTLFSVLAGVAGVIRFWDGLVLDIAPATGFVVAYLFALATTIITYRQTRRADTELRLREDLIREVHHRVKNEAALLLSLIDEEVDAAHGEDARAALVRERRRITAVLGTHQHLISPSEHRLIPLASYISGLVEPLTNELASRGRVPRISCTTTEVEVHGSQAVPIGLIINELLSNAVKYQSSSLDWQIDVSVSLFGEKGIVVTVSNDTSEASVASSEGDGFGLEFVRRLAETMRGSVAVSQDTRFVVSVTLPRVLQYER
jgi:two-component sensor histidine kinase